MTVTNVVYESPIGVEEVGPDARFIREVLTETDATYWGCGSGSGTFVRRLDSVWQKLFITVDVYSGVRLLYLVPGAELQVAFDGDVEGDTASLLDGQMHVSVPYACLIPTDRALEAILYFIESGKKCPDLEWTSWFDVPGDD